MMQAKRRPWTEEAGLIEEFHGCAAVLAQGLVNARFSCRGSALRHV